MFHRFDGRKAVTLDPAYVPHLTVEEASALDAMLVQARGCRRGVRAHTCSQLLFVQSR